MFETIYWFLISPLLKWVGLAGVIAAGSLFLWATMPVWMPHRFRDILLMIGIGAIMFIGISTYFFNAGQDHFAQRIAAKDAAAERRVNRALHSVDACYDAGGRWDQTVGACSK